MTCPAGCKAKAVARVGRRTARKLRLGTRTVGGAQSRTLTAGQTATLRVRLTARARRRLRSARAVQLSIKVTLAVGGDATTRTHSVTLRR